MATPRAAAEHYLRRDLAPIPLPTRSKDPGYPGWPDLRITAADLDLHFPAGAALNVGILNGEPSSLHHDVDLDCREAIAAAPLLLPATDWIFGRASARGAHRIYVTDCPLAKSSEEFRDLDGEMLVELRGDRGLTVYPPSIHRGTGERIEWERFDTAGRVTLAELFRAVQQLAAAALLARHWPARGARDDAALALTGALSRAGRAADCPGRFVEAVALAAGDEEYRSRGSKAQATAARQADGRKTTGWPTLAGLLGERGDAVIRQVRRWLGLTADTGPSPQAVRQIPPYRPFPVEALPPLARDLAVQAGAAIGCDVALVAVPLLATLAGAIGNSRCVRLKSGWFEPPILWGLTVADSGGHKSPAFHAAVKPLQELQMDLYDAHRLQMQDYERAMQEYKEADRDRRGEAPRPPGPPTCFVVSDPTVQALAEVLEQNPHGLLMARDELDGWFQSFTRFSGTGATDRPHWLELHAGGTLLVRRKTGDRPTIAVRRAVCSVTGTIQPAVLARALDREALQSGLGARFLMTMPPRRERTWNEHELPDDLLDRYRDLLKDLLDLPLEDATKRKPHVLRLSPGARRLFVGFYNEWGRVQYAAAEEQASAFAKIEAYGARLTLLHHIVCHVAAGSNDLVEITPASVEAGITLARWFAHEATRVYATLTETAEQRDTRRLLEYIRGRGAAITVKQLQRANQRRFPTADAAESALNALVPDHGSWVDRLIGPTGGRPTRVFRLHPPVEVEDGAANLSGMCDETDETSSGGPAGPTPTVAPVCDETCDETSSILDIPGYSGGFVGFVTQPFESASGEEGQEQAGGVSSHSPGGFVTQPLDVEDEGDGLSPGGHDTPPEEYEPPGQTSLTETRCDSITRPAGQVVGRGTGHPATPLPPYRLVTAAAELSRVLDALDNTLVVALDLETTGLDPRTDRVRLLSLGTDTVAGTPFAYLLDVQALDPAALVRVLDRLADKDLVAHNAAFDLGFLSRLGFTPRGKVHDTMLLAQLLVAGTYDRVGLADCCKRWLDRDLDKSEQKGNWSGPLTDARLAYAADDVRVLPPLLEKLTAEIGAAGLVEAAELECRCLPALGWLGGTGVPLNRAAWLALADAARVEAEQLRRELDALAPRKPGELFNDAWNWSSPVQVKQALALAGCPVEATDDAALAAVAHPLAGLLRSYRQAEKRVGVYGAGWLDHVRADGRVYPHWRQIGSRAGRMSCSDPNMQQLPRGKEYRRCVAAPAGRVLVKADYSQIELRIAARVSGDQALLAAYRRGDDLHTLTARKVLQVEEVTKADRQLAKALNFGLLYGMGANGFRAYARAQYHLDLTDVQAKEYRAAFFRAYPGLAAWHRQVRTARVAQTRTLTGRRRLLDATTPDTHRLNSPVQGTGADGLKLALALLWETRDRVPDAVPVLAVHDEIVVECNADRADAAAAWLKACMMEAMAPLIAPVPVEVTATVGITWGED